MTLKPVRKVHARVIETPIDHPGLLLELGSSSPSVKMA